MNRAERRAATRQGKAIPGSFTSIQDKFAEALQCHQSGRLGEAIDCYGLVLDCNPDFAAAHYNLGAAFKQQGRTDYAIRCFRRALELAPDDPDAHNNLGNLLKEQGHPDEAIVCYRTAIGLKPDYFQAHFNLGATLKQQGQLDAAIACFCTTIEIKPDYPEAFYNLAVTLHAQRRLDEAIACYRHALNFKPDFFEAWSNLGEALRQADRLDEAVDCLCKVLELKPDLAEAHNNLGLALKEKAQFVEAADCCRTALALDPRLAEAHNNLGIIFKELGQLDAAIVCFNQALRLQPDPEAHNNLGTALQELGRLDEAIGWYRKARDLGPDFADPHNNLGNTLLEQGHLDQAIACYRTSIDLRPDYADAHFHLGMALLARGDMPEGWQEYEWRWKTRQLSGARRNFAQPQWRGEPAEGRTLLMHAEQGFGDTLQFCRYASLAAARGLRVIMEVSKPLVRLMGSLAGVDQVVACGEALPPFDLHCPMLSMPLAVGTTIATIPGAASYLRPDAEQVAAWQARLAGTIGHGLRIGLVWAGNPRTHLQTAASIDRRRSMSPDRLTPLLDMSGVHFFSLQKDGPAAPNDFPLIDLMGEMRDFADTAALIANLDLVISVDTAVAHLASAVGTPVWMLDRFDPCWRWFTGRRDSPWYPAMQIYRQSHPGAWDVVIAEVMDDLRRLAMGFAECSTHPTTSARPAT